MVKDADTKCKVNECSLIFQNKFLFGSTVGSAIKDLTILDLSRQNQSKNNFHPPILVLDDCSCFNVVELQLLVYSVF